MLAYTSINHATLRAEPRPLRWLIQSIACFQGRDGLCRFSERQLTEHAGEHLSWVCRNLQLLMEREGIKRLAPGVYRLAERFTEFLTRRAANSNVPKTGTQTPCDRNAAVPTVGTPEEGDIYIPPKSPRSRGDRQQKNEGERGADTAGAIPCDKVADEIRQRGHLRQFFGSGGQIWPEVRGPRPGEAGCLYPAKLIEEYRRRRDAA